MNRWMKTVMSVITAFFLVLSCVGAASADGASTVFVQYVNAHGVAQEPADCLPVAETMETGWYVSQTAVGKSGPAPSGIA